MHIELTNETRDEFCRMLNSRMWLFVLKAIQDERRAQMNAVMSGMLDEHTYAWQSGRYCALNDILKAVYTAADLPQPKES